MLQVPPEGIDSRQLRKYVEDLTLMLNAVLNMTVESEGKHKLKGYLQIHGGSCTLKLHEGTEVGSLGG